MIELQYSTIVKTKKIVAKWEVLISIIHSVSATRSCQIGHHTDDPPQQADQDKKS